jgi:hypothetical protein
VGGAGNAAKSLHLNLISSGVDSEFWYLSGLKRKFPELVLGKITSIISQLISSVAYFTPRSISLSSLEEVVANCDKSTTILHFHNWFNITNFKQIAHLRGLGYNIVCTLHDERNYTGGCHYAIGCKQFQTACLDCPNVKLGRSRLIKSSFIRSQGFDLAKLGVDFVAPSKWILGRARQSKLLSDSRIHFIPNIISISPAESREELGSLAKIGGVITLGVASMNPKDAIKGGGLIADLIPFQKEFNFKLIFMKDFSDIRKFWAMTDCLLVPSVIDNSPNVVHEAKLRSIPIIATKVGGIGEMFSEFDVELKELTVVHFLESLSIARSKSFEFSNNQIYSNFLKYLGNPLDSHLSLYGKIIDRRD